MRPVCRNVVPAGLQTCLCLPAAIRLNVRRLMRIYQSASLSWNQNAGVSAIAASGMKAFMLITSAYTAFIMCKTQTTS